MKNIRRQSISVQSTKFKEGRSLEMLQPCCELACHDLQDSTGYIHTYNNENIDASFRSYKNGRNIYVSCTFEIMPVIMVMRP